MASITDVYMDAESPLYQSKPLSHFEIKKIFQDENIPEVLVFQEDGKKVYPLDWAIDYLEESFSQWVQNNCERVVKDCVDDIISFEDLTPAGQLKFNKKRLEYQRRLEEATGFTCWFMGGLLKDLI